MYINGWSWCLFGKLQSLICVLVFWNYWWVLSLVGFLVPFTAPATSPYLLVCFLSDVFSVASVLILLCINYQLILRYYSTIYVNYCIVSKFISKLISPKRYKLKQRAHFAYSKTEVIYNVIRAMSKLMSFCQECSKYVCIMLVEWLWSIRNSHYC